MTTERDFPCSAGAEEGGRGGGGEEGVWGGGGEGEREGAGAREDGGLSQERIDGDSDNNRGWEGKSLQFAPAAGRV